jgi:hypothetical protein
VIKVLDSAGREKTTLSVGTSVNVGLPSLIQTNTTLNTNQVWSHSDSLEVDAGIELELGDGSEVVLDGDGDGADVGYINLGWEEGPGNVDTNLSTAGTIDWFALGSVTTPPRSNPQAASINWKGLGLGKLMQSFDWILDGGPTLFTQAFVPTLTTNIGDDGNDANKAATNVGVGLFTSTGALYGFRISVPAGPKTRVLRIMVSSFGGVATMRCTLTHSGITKSYTQQHFNNGTAAERVAKIAFRAAGGELVVSYRNESTGLSAGTNPNVKLLFAYLSES